MYPLSIFKCILCQYGSQFNRFPQPLNHQLNTQWANCDFFCSVSPEAPLFRSVDPHLDGSSVTIEWFLYGSSWTNEWLFYGSSWTPLVISLISSPMRHLWISSPLEFQEGILCTNRTHLLRAMYGQCMGICFIFGPKL